MSLSSTLTKPTPQELRDKLSQDPSLFLNTCQELEARTFDSALLKIGRFEDATETQMSATLQELEEHGCGLWPGFLADQDLIEELRLIIARAHSRSRRLFLDLDPAKTQVDDPEIGWRYVRCANVVHDGITRADFWPGQTEIPESIVRVWQDQRLSGLISRYYRRPTPVTHALAERVFYVPSTDLVGWHVDRIMDQCKVMILLTDVDERNAPFRYRCGTHRASKEKNTFFHQYFNHGVKYSECSNNLAQSMGTHTRVFTGKAGDAVFFDTCGIHTRTMCFEGTREVLNFNFTDAQTPKNNFFNAIRGTDWM